MPSLQPSSTFTYTKRIVYGGCDDGYIDYGYYCVSPWYAYGRWILVGALIVGAFLLFCIFSCITARRRKRRGLQPFRGTGWATGGAPGAGGAYPGPGGPQNYYNTGYNYGQQQQPPPGGWQQPPPQYAPPADGTHYGKSGPEPYGGQPGSVELQSPSQSYQPQGGYGPPAQGGQYQNQYGGDQVYQPPAGPPPNKDGVIR